MKIDILTLFPSMFSGPFDTSMLKKAQDIDAVKINVHDLRNWANNKHNQVDDRPFGGGPGMVLMIEPIDNALKDLSTKSTHKILLSPKGSVFKQKRAVELSKLNHLILVCGHYEGFDERIRENLIDEEISIGNYILTGGEIPAMAITDAVVRLLPGVLAEEAKTNESFMMDDKLDYPVYTRPQSYKGWDVPEVMISGNHAEIEKWRKNSQKKPQD